MENKQLTPMQEAIEMFKDVQKHIISNTEFAKGYDEAITDVITNLEKLLPKENRLIKDTWIDGVNDKMKNKDISAQDYYNNKFKND